MYSPGTFANTYVDFSHMTQLRILKLEGFVHTHAFPPNLLYLTSHYQHLEIDQICKLHKVIVLDLEGFPNQDFPNIAEEVCNIILQTLFVQKGHIIIWATIKTKRTRMLMG